MKKEKLRQYYKTLKPPIPENIQTFLKQTEIQQQQIIPNFNIKNITISDYNLDFPKLKFINAISSMYYKGRVGRKLDKLIYYTYNNSKIFLGYIQLSSPILNSKLSQFLKQYFNTKTINFNTLNKTTVDLSVCIAYGPLTNFLTGKLMFFIASSKEIINQYNQKYNTNIQILTTTSIFGKSSIYNRIRNLKYLGLSEGYHSILTKNQVNEIKTKYKQHFPHRKIKTTALSEHLIRLYLHLKDAGAPLSFEIPKQQRGVYVTTTFYPLQENLDYWYSRWFLPRYTRITNSQ